MTWRTGKSVILMFALSSCGGGPEGADDASVDASVSADAAPTDGSGNLTDGTTADEVPPTVQSTSPIDEATDVALDAAVRVTFSESIEPSSLTPSSFTLEVSGGAVVSGAVVADEAEGTLTPDSSLVNGTTFVATLTTAVTDVAGNPLGSEVSWSFSTPDQTWGAGGPIETSDDNATAGDVAADSSGNAIVVWSQTDGVRINLWANRYQPGAGWAVAELIESDNTGNVAMPQIVMDPAGNAIAVWQQHDGLRTNIWANRYLANVGWGAAEEIESGDENASFASIASDAAGNMIAVWEQRDGPWVSVWTNRYSVDDGWGTAEEIEDDDTGDAALAHVAVGPDGNGFAVWHHDDGIRDNIWANRYVVGVGWATPQPIETHAEDVRNANVAIDSTGNAIVVWMQVDSLDEQVWSNRYAAGIGWGAAERIDDDLSDSAEFPVVAMDPEGNAIAAWSDDRQDIKTNRYAVGAGWGTAALIATDDDLAYEVQVTVDRAGNAIAVWAQDDESTYTQIYACRYSIQEGWGSPQWAEAGAIQSEAPSIAVDDQGNAIVAWQEHDATRYDIWANWLE